MIEDDLDNHIIFILISFKYYIIGTDSELESKNLKKEFACLQCGITFDNVDDAEEHDKLEHKEHKIPSGCG